MFVSNPAMTTVQSIEQAVQNLPARDLAELRRWFSPFDEAAWDAQIESDSAARKLDTLAAEALAEDLRGTRLRQGSQKLGGG